ncbi:MAG: TlpA disulfide reductase family protein [Campylobacterales bacterium]|nr:TlpA disulfide reductase family protein [Campylobacterales bacterium]
MIKTSILTAIFTFAILFSGCSDNNKKKESNTTKQTTEAVNSMISTPEYVLKTLKNEQLTVKETPNGFVLDSAKDKIVIFDIFATWCPPCQGSASHLSSLQKKFKDDLIIIGVTIEENISNEKLQEFSTAYKANYTLVNSDQNRRLVNAIAASLKVGEKFPIPLMAMYKDGQLVKHYLGAVQEEFIESDIKKALGK